jgi:selenocysteine lyase/cysteine desulfurase
VGAVAMASAARFLSEDLGWDWLVRHERELTSYALEKLNTIPGLTIYGPHDPALPEDRLGVISFNMDTLDHRLTAAILSHEYAIGTRSGCFCAHPYLIRLFQVPHELVHDIRDQLVHGDRHAMPGAVRMSFGFYNSREDVDAIVDALRAIQRGEYRGEYRQDKASGEFQPVGAEVDLARWFKL